MNIALPKEPGIYTYPATKIVSVEPVGSSGKAFWVDFGFDRKVKSFVKTKTALEPGAVADLVVEVKDDEFNGTVTKGAAFVKSFGGQADSGRGGGGRGGGGGNWQPKSHEEIHSSCVAGLIKSVFNYAGTREEELSDERIGTLINLALAGYSRGVNKFKPGAAPETAEPRAASKPSGLQPAHVPMGDVK